MLDPGFVRDHMDDVRAGLRNRGLNPDAELEQLATLEARRRRLIPEIEGLKREQNAAGDEVARAKDSPTRGSAGPGGTAAQRAVDDDSQPAACQRTGWRQCRRQQGSAAAR